MSGWTDVWHVIEEIGSGAQLPRGPPRAYQHRMLKVALVGVPPHTLGSAFSVRVSWNAGRQ